MLFKGKIKGAEAESKNWYKDKYESIRQQRDILMVVTLLALAGAAMASLVVMSITPYKSVEPFVIQIDEKAGVVQRVDPVTRTEFTANEAIDRYFAVQYVQAREAYVPSIFTEQYSQVRVMSSTPIFRQYAQEVGRRNEQSPVNVLGNKGQRSITIKNISFVGRSEQHPRASKVAIVRILRKDVNYQTARTTQLHQVVTLEFQYSNLVLNEEERHMNPLGFLVTDYQIAQEVVE